MVLGEHCPEMRAEVSLKGLGEFVQPELDLRKRWLKSPGGMAVRDYQYPEELPQGNGRSKGQGFPSFLSFHFLILALRSRRPDRNWDSVKQQSHRWAHAQLQEQPVSFELPQKKRYAVHKILSKGSEIK